MSAWQTRSLGLTCSGPSCRVNAAGEVVRRQRPTRRCAERRSREQRAQDRWSTDVQRADGEEGGLLLRLAGDRAGPPQPPSLTCRVFARPCRPPCPHVIQTSTSDPKLLRKLCTQLRRHVCGRCHVIGRPCDSRCCPCGAFTLPEGTVCHASKLCSMTSNMLLPKVIGDYGKARLANI